MLYADTCAALTRAFNLNDPPCLDTFAVALQRYDKLVHAGYNPWTKTSYRLDRGVRWWCFRPGSVVWHASVQYTLGSVLFVLASYFALFDAVVGDVWKKRCVGARTSTPLAVSHACQSAAVHKLGFVQIAGYVCANCQCALTGLASSAGADVVQSLPTACRWLFAYPYAIGSIMYTIGASLLLGVSWVNHPEWAHPPRPPQVLTK